jgi:hypothetical protein
MSATPAVPVVERLVISTVSARAIQSAFVREVAPHDPTVEVSSKSALPPAEIEIPVRSAARTVHASEPSLSSRLENP